MVMSARLAHVTSDGADRLGIGGNNPPAASPFDAVQIAVLDLADDARATLTGAAIENEEQATVVSALVQKARKIEGAVDDARVADKAPHHAAGKAVDMLYKPLTKDCDRIKGSALALLGPWLEAVKAQQNAAAVEAAKIAAAKLAEVAATARDVTDYASQEAFEDKVKDAQRSVADAARAAKERPTASGDEGRAIGLRIVRNVTVDDATAFARYLWASRRADYDAWLYGMADSLLESGARSLPGVTIVERMVAR
jgi:hypothetical protein